MVETGRNERPVKPCTEDGAELGLPGDNPSVGERVAVEFCLRTDARDGNEGGGVADFWMRGIAGGGPSGSESWRRLWG